LGAHLDAELKIDPDDPANPRAAAADSALSFTVRALRVLVGGALGVALTYEIGLFGTAIG
jgi:hypothetical protein